MKKKSIHGLVNRCLTRGGKINVDITFASNTMILAALNLIDEMLFTLKVGGSQTDFGN